jgi:hypothetical protein
MPVTERPLTKLQSQVLAVIADAKSGEISGLSITTWLLRRHNKDGVRTVLRSLENRGLITMRRTENNEWPDRMKAMFSIRADRPLNEAERRTVRVFEEAMTAVMPHILEERRGREEAWQRTKDLILD